MRVLVCGSRDWTDGRLIRSVLAGVEGMSVVITGYARGADMLAVEAANEWGLPLQSYPAEWDSESRAAGPIRNARMLREGRPDRVIAFSDHLSTSKGTLDMVRRSLAAGVPVTHAYHEADGMWQTRQVTSL